MSAFLGPIHYWLFNKIVTLESRAFALSKTLEDNGVDVSSLTDQYGNKLEGEDIGEIIGNNPIHQFLSGLITRVQVFEAQVVERAGTEHLDKLLARALLHGSETAANAIEKQGGSKPEGLGGVENQIQTFQLDGMPCDPAGELSLISDKELSYSHTTCNHLGNWAFTGVDKSSMCKITNVWLEGFVKGLRENAEYSVESAIADGADSCLAKITES